MRVARILKHATFGGWSVGRFLSTEDLSRIDQAITESELQHSAEICFVIEPNLSVREVLRGLTARDRAVEVFSERRVWDTERNNGVLLYLLLAERDIEIIADRGFRDRVTAEQWGKICELIEQHAQQNVLVEGIIQGVLAIGELAKPHFPPMAIDTNEIGNIVY